MAIDVKQLADDISSIIGEMTPDSTVCVGEEAPSNVSDDDVLPECGGTYEIIDDDGRSLTVEKGKLVLAYESSGNKACHWRCEKKEGWFGFSNAVTARYLGYNRNSDLIADAGHHRDWEYIHILPTRAGYYKLLVIQGQKLLEVAVEGRKKLVIRQDGGCEWRFRKAMMYI